MTAGVNNQQVKFSQLTAKLQEKQQMQESLNAQKNAVQDKLNDTQDQVQYREGITEKDKQQLSEYVVAYSNLEPPTEVAEPGNKPVQSDYQKDVTGENGQTTKADDTEAFNKAQKEWETKNEQYEKYQKDLETYNNKKEALETKINEYKKTDEENTNFLNDLVKVAQDKETELVAAGKAVDVNTGDIEKINQEIKDMGNISFEVESGDSKGYYAAVSRQMSELAESGALTKSNGESYTKAELAQLCQKLVEMDTENGVENGNDGNSKYYRTMQAGKSYGNYSLDQINELAKTLGYDGINTDDTSFSFSMEDLEKSIDDTSKVISDNTVLIEQEAVDPPVEENNGDGGVQSTSSTSNSLSASEISQKIKDLKSGESFTYKVPYTDIHGNQRFIDFTVTKGDDGTYTKSYNVIGGKKQVTYDENNNTISTTRSGFKTALSNTTTNYNSDGSIKDKTVDLSNYSTADVLSALPREAVLYNYLNKGKNNYSSQVLKDDSSKVLIKIEGGKFYDGKNKEIDENKAYKIITKAIKKGNLSNLTQIK